jgi:hypothetical protein
MTEGSSRKILASTKERGTRERLARMESKDPERRREEERRR